MHGGGRDGADAGGARAEEARERGCGSGRERMRRERGCAGAHEERRCVGGCTGSGCGRGGGKVGKEGANPDGRGVEGVQASELLAWMTRRASTSGRGRCGSREDGPEEQYYTK